MPVENETKFVLDDPDGALEAQLGRCIRARAVDILQAYLGKDVRIRRIVPVRGGPATFVMSFKRRVGGARIEIETPMTARDFASLLPTADAVLRKRRFTVADGDVSWDIDFLKAGGRTYFVLAEAEMPEGMEEPERLPEPVASHLLRHVGRGKAYGNRRLADPSHALGILDALRAAGPAAFGQSAHGIPTATRAA